MNIINDFLEQLNIKNSFESDPQIMRKVLEDLHLNNFLADFEDEDNFFSTIINESIDLFSLIETLKNNVIQNNPELVEVIKYALENDIIKRTEEINYIIHHTYVLEYLTFLMSNNNEIALKIYENFQNKKKEIGLTSGSLFNFIKLYRLTKCFFCTMKYMSIDPYIKLMLLKRGGTVYSNDQAKSKYKDGELNYFEYKAAITKENSTPNKGLRLNLYEVTYTDYFSGNTDNAYTGYSLISSIINTPSKSFDKDDHVVPESSCLDFHKNSKYLRDDNEIIKIGFKPGWIPLYHSWDMVYLLGNMDYLDLLFPKLLIPSVFAAKEENYIYARIFSLWLSGNAFIFRKAKRIKSREYKNKFNELILFWGKVNKKYADQMLENDDPKLVERTKKEFKRQFIHKRAWPFIKLFF